MSTKSRQNLRLVLGNLEQSIFSLYQLANNSPFLQQDSSVGLIESPRSQAPAISPKSRSRALSPIQEEEEEDEEKEGEGQGEGGGEGEEESETEEEGGQNADSPENNAGC